MCLRHRLSRLLLPYLAWSLVLFLIPGWLHGRITGPDALRGLAFGWTFTGAYYLIALAQLSLLAPLLALALDRLGSRRAWTGCLALLAATSAYHALAAYGSGRLPDIARNAFSVSLSLFPVWSPFFIAGLLLGRDAGALLPRLPRLRTLWVAAAILLFATSLCEFAVVLARARSIGLAASFLKPTSAVFALAVCAFMLGSIAPDARLPRLVRAIAEGSFAIYLVHGGIVHSLGGITLPAWQALIGGSFGPLVLGVLGIVVPLMIFRAARAWLPDGLCFVVFGSEPTHLHHAGPARVRPGSSQARDEATKRPDARVR